MSAQSGKKPEPRLDVDKTREKLARLGLEHVAGLLEDKLTAAARDEVPPYRFLDQLLDDELGSREERRIRTSLRLSGIPPGMTLGNFDFSFQPGIERGRIDTLATCGWIREKQTLLMQGPPGVGKTHLASAQSVRAVECGFSVAFHRLEELIALLRADAGVPSARLRRRKYMNVALLTIDEVGFEQLGRAEASLLFRLVSYRYGRGSILITTNKGIKDWPEMLAGDEVLATAILDRNGADAAEGRACTGDENWRGHRRARHRACSSGTPEHNPWVESLHGELKLEPDARGELGTQGAEPSQGHGSLAEAGSHRRRAVSRAARGVSRAS